MSWVSMVIVDVVMLYGCRGLAGSFRVALRVVVLDTGAVLGINTTRRGETLLVTLLCLQTFRIS